MRVSLRRTAIGLLGVGLVVATIATLVAIDDALFKEWGGGQRFIDDLHQLAANPRRTVLLADLTGHPVDRTCWLPEYLDALPSAIERGLPIGALPDVVVRENHVGLLMAGSDTTSYGELGTDWIDLNQSNIYRGTGCVTGGQLALQFDTIDPLSGGRLVDLDAPDLRPTLIE